MTLQVGLYYFSATGNSLTTAQILAQKLPFNCDLIALASLKDEKDIQVDYDTVGFVFPIYYGDMPYLVRYIINKMNLINVKYIFVFSTYRGHPGDIAKRMDDVLKEKNQHLSLSVGIYMPGNSYLSTKEEIEDSLKNQNKNIQLLCQKIIDQEKYDYSLLESPEPSPVAKGFYNMRGLMADNKCIGCGICQKVCPMDNIQIIDKHARIQNQCITCLACFHWCPVEAISMSKEKEIEYREKYHHPDVKLKDIIDQKIV